MALIAFVWDRQSPSWQGVHRGGAESYPRVLVPVISRERARESERE